MVVQVVMPSVEALQALSDADLQLRQRDFAAIRRQVDAGSALVAAELARRSTRELGYSGLAQREGLRSPEQLVERLAGVTPEEARALVRVGSLEGAIATAVASGSVSVLAAEAIHVGLGEPTPTVPSSALADATDLLLSVAGEVPVRRLAAQARAVRDSLDTAGVAEREEAMRQRRFLRLIPQPDGMTRVSGLLEPESAALVSSAFDAVTSPRRGGVRFIDPDEKQRAQLIVDDPRTTEQLLADAFVEMVRIAGAADTGRVFGQHRPAVTVHVDVRDLDRGSGAAHLDGQGVPVSIDTAERLACTAGSIPVLFAFGEPLDVGRAQRTFTDRQRIAMAARDGGCRFPECERPPSWCEAHHIDEWARDLGLTNVDSGVLLCRFHHLMVHNQGWRIEKRTEQFVAIPPPGGGRDPVELPSSNSVYRAREARLRMEERADDERVLADA